MIIWSLFDSGQSAYKRVVDEYFPKHTNYSLGIDKTNRNSNFINVDLADYKSIFADNTLFEKLDELPKPDIILASPPCESWSVASAMRGGNAFYRWTENKDGHLDIRTDDEIVSKNHTPFKHYPDKTLYTRVNGELCAFNTIEIIKKYHPKYWVIENPQGSQIWKYLEFYHNFTGYRNIAHYAKYNENFPKKPTCFLSNIKLNLKTMNKNEKATIHMSAKNAKKYGTKYYGRDYNVRSNIPDELIVDMLQQIELYEKEVKIK